MPIHWTDVHRDSCSLKYKHFFSLCDGIYIFIYIFCLIKYKQNREKIEITFTAPYQDGILKEGESWDLLKLP